LGLRMRRHDARARHHAASFITHGADERRLFYLSERRGDADRLEQEQKQQGNSVQKSRDHVRLPELLAAARIVRHFRAEVLQRQTWSADRPGTAIANPL